MPNGTGRWFYVALPAVFASLATAKAGGQDNKQDGFSDIYQSGKYELTLSSGALFSPIGADHDRPTLNYTLSTLQFGWMFTDVRGSGWLRGNWETTGEIMGGTVFAGRGNYMAGATGWLKYNFVQPDWRVAPYLGAGVGAEATDFDPSLIGETFNFNLNIAAGMKCFITSRWALDLQCRYQHISNAKISNRDIGINAVGPIVGLSYLF